MGGCNSDTLGLSNTLSEVIEAVAQSKEEPFEVISAEDMLNRVYKCNDKIKELQAKKGPDWKWQEELILLGSDVKSLFPSLSAEKTGRAVRSQFEKSDITWQNIDWKLLTLYVKLNENYWKESEI